jgi:preprotein translocase subunit YajC
MRRVREIGEIREEGKDRGRSRDSFGFILLLLFLVFWLLILRLQDKVTGVETEAATAAIISLSSRSSVV